MKSLQTYLQVNSKEDLVIITSGIWTEARQEKGLHDWAQKWMKSKFAVGL